MPVAIPELKITPLVHDPKETKVDFGATVEGVDLNNLDGESLSIHQAQELTLRQTRLSS